MNQNLFNLMQQEHGVTLLESEMVDIDVAISKDRESTHSKRGQDWIKFSEEVLDHIENYTVPQYGDKDVDQLTTYKSVDCKKQVEKYLNRHGKNSRPGQEDLDILKTAHYLQVMLMIEREVRAK